MNKEKYLFTCLQEECAELSQRAAKIVRFGLKEKQPGQDKDNFERLIEEFRDLMGVAKYIDRIYGKLLDTNNEVSDTVNQKIIKLDKYMDYSREIGELD